MIEHILHAIAHAVEEHYSEENIQKRKQKEIEHKLAVKNNKPKIDAIKKDCEAAVLYAAKARLSGVKIQETIYPGMSHDWTLFYPELKESRAMFKELKSFIDDNMGVSAPAK